MKNKFKKFIIKIFNIKLEDLGYENPKIVKYHHTTLTPIQIRSEKSIDLSRFYKREIPYDIKHIILKELLEEVSNEIIKNKSYILEEADMRENDNRLFKKIRLTVNIVPPKNY